MPRYASLSDVHPEKAPPAIVSTSGKLTLVSLDWPLNAFSPIVFTVDGSVMEPSSGQPFSVLRQLAYKAVTV